MKSLEQGLPVQTSIQARLKRAFATTAHFNQHRAVTVKACSRDGELSSHLIRFHALTRALVVLLTLLLLPVRHCRFAARLRRLR